MNILLVLYFISITIIVVNFKYVDDHDKDTIKSLSIIPVINTFIAILAILKKGNSYYFYNKRKNENNLAYYKYLNKHSPEFYKIKKSLLGLKKKEIKVKHSSHETMRGSSFSTIKARGFSLTESNKNYKKLKYKKKEIDLSYFDLKEISRIMNSPLNY